MAVANQMNIDRQNQVLAALPDVDYKRLEPHLQVAHVRTGEVLYESGAPLKCLYFPLNCVMSLAYEMENGVSSELSIVGSEGVVGISSIMGRETAPNRAIVQREGQAIRIRADALQKEFQRGGALQIQLLRYAHALLTEMAQTVLCNRYHCVQQQLCRWLLVMQDHFGTRELGISQQHIADMLGVRREGVTQAAGVLQDIGWIRYSRGCIVVIDRLGLEGGACECYQILKKEYGRLLAPERSDTSRLPLWPASPRPPSRSNYSEATS
jgi:CRP-like cAMP-binding protein